MRHSGYFLAAALAAAAGAAPLQAAASPQIKETRVGGTLVLKLPGNPRAGYKWQLNAEQSRGLDIVDVKQIGWILAPEGRSMFFRKESILNVAVQAKSPGEASLAFDYFRTWGNRMTVRTTTVRVIVKPAETARR